MFFLFLISNALAYSKLDFNQSLYWKQQPNIVMCSDTKVKEENLKKAMDFWRQIGYNVPNNIIKKNCGIDLHVSNEIRLTGQRDLDTVRYYAITDRNYYYDKNEEKIFLVSANIKFESESANNLKLLIHEIGHALGIEHEKSDKSHIMHHQVVDQKTRYN